MGNDAFKERVGQLIWSARESAGVPYSQEYRSVEVTEHGQDIVSAMYDPHDDPESE